MWPIDEILLMVGLLFPGWLLTRILRKFFSETISKLEILAASVLLSSFAIAAPMSVAGYLQLPILKQFSIIYVIFASGAALLFVIQNGKDAFEFARRRVRRQELNLFHGASAVLAIGILLHILMHPLQDWDGVQLYLPDALAIVRSNVIPIINPINQAPIIFPTFTSQIFAWATMATGTAPLGNWYYPLRFLPLPYIVASAALLYRLPVKWGLGEPIRKMALILFLLSPMLFVHLDYFLYYTDIYFLFFAFGSLAWLLMAGAERPSRLMIFLSASSSAMAVITKPHGVFVPLLWIMTYFLIWGKKSKVLAFSAVNATIILSPFIVGNPTPAADLLTALILVFACLPFISRSKWGESPLRWSALIGVSVLALSGGIWVLRNLLLFGTPFGEAILTQHGASDVAWANNLLLRNGVFNLPNGEDHLGQFSVVTLFVDSLWIPTLLIFRLAGLFKSRRYREVNVLVVWTFVYLSLWILDVRHFSFRQLIPLVPIVAIIDAIGIMSILARSLEGKVSAATSMSFAILALLLSSPFIAGAMRDFPNFPPLFGLPISYYLNFNSSFLALEIGYSVVLIVALFSLGVRWGNLARRLPLKTSAHLSKVLRPALLLFLLALVVASPINVLLSFGSFGSYDTYVRTTFYSSELYALNVALTGQPSDTSILAFGIWGAELFTNHTGYDISRIYYLAQIRSIFTSQNVTYILEGLHSKGLRVAVLPASPALPYYPVFLNLKYSTGSFLMLLLDNPLVFQASRVSDWDILRLTKSQRFSGFVDITLREGNLTLGSALSGNYWNTTRFGPDANMEVTVDFSGLVSQQVAAGSSVEIALSSNVSTLGYNSTDSQWHILGAQMVTELVRGMSGQASIPVGLLLRQVADAKQGFSEYGVRFNYVNASVLVDGSVLASIVARPLGEYTLSWFPSMLSGNLSQGWSNWTYSQINA